MRSLNKRNKEMQMSEAELISMTSDLKDAHSDTLPALHSSLQAWVREGNDHNGTPSGLSRRSFLARSGLLAAGGFLVATTGAAATPIPRTLNREDSAAALRGAANAPLNVKVAALAASLENLAVATYGAALNAAAAGKLGTVPNAIATFIETATAQHKDHAAAWNAMIVSAGFHKITAPNADIGKSVNAAFATVTDIPGVAKLALTLDDAAAATYLEAVSVVTGRQAIETAATIQPVEMQHAAILNFVLGQYPVPKTFATMTGAATHSQGPALSAR